MLSRWNTPFLDMQSQVEQLLEELVYRRWPIARPTGCRPPLDLHETPDANPVENDLPGVVPEEVQVLVGERCLTVTGERLLVVPEAALFSRCERATGPFHRTLELPLPIDPKRASVEYRHGTCRLILPKRPPREKPAASRTSEPAETVRIVAILPPAQSPGAS